MLDKTAKRKVEVATSAPIPPAMPTMPVNRKLQLTIDGITPLITHNPASMGIDVSAKRGSRIPTAEDEAENGVYRLEDGTCGMKGEATRAACLGAAGAWKAAKRSTMKSHLAHIMVVEELVALRRFNGEAITDYVIDRRRAIVQRQGIIRCRPRFDEWSMVFTFIYDPMLVKDPAIIAEIMNDAGNRVGIGDYRPQRNGPFGRFSVRAFQVVD